MLGPWFVDVFQKAARAPGVRLDMMILRPDRVTALARGVGRPDHPMRDPQVIPQLWDQFAELGDLAGHALDTTGLNLDQTAALAQAALASGRQRLS